MINENDVTNQRVSKRRELGMVYIPEDRDHDGFALRASVCENSILGYLNQSRFVKYGLLRYKNIFEHCSTIITKYSVKVNDINQATSQLSGGNLQKLVVGREFEQHGQLLIAEQPTRGVDINSTEFIHKCLLDFTQKGNAVLLISYELSEILSLADRILVMFDGEIIGETKGSLADEWTIGLWMVGKKDLTTESNLA